MDISELLRLVIIIYKEFIFLTHTDVYIQIFNLETQIMHIQNQ